MSDDWAAQIVRFWFEELPADAWFRRDEQIDAAIRERFAALYERLKQVQPQDLTTPQQCVAAVIALDQFPRNMFRGSPRAFATDPLALSIAERAIAAGFDAQLDPVRRTFLYMPFQHSESPAVQARSVQLFAQLGDASTLDYARQHKEIIDRFERFPHRNEVLGRASTPQELQFLTTHRGF